MRRIGMEHIFINPAKLNVEDVIIKMMNWKVTLGITCVINYPASLNCYAKSYFILSRNHLRNGRTFILNAPERKIAENRGWKRNPSNGYQYYLIQTYLVSSLLNGFCLHVLSQTYHPTYIY